MLYNKWIIVKKEKPVDTVGLFMYTLVMVDSKLSKKQDMRRQTFSKKQFKIGSFIDDNLNPLSEQYNPAKTDIATVQSTKVISPTGQNKSNYRVSFFNDVLGDFDITITLDRIPFAMKRGDTVLVRAQTTHELQIKFVKNLSTGAKSKFYNPRNKGRKESFQKVIIIGINRCRPQTDYAKKHVLTYSEKFGYSSFILTTSNIEYPVRIGDKLLLQKHQHKKTSDFEILRNLTIDEMRTGFLNKR